MHLETLKTGREKILAYFAEVENENQEMLKTAESEREKIVAEFRKLRQLLQEQEDRLLAQVEEVEKEIARKRDEHLARLSEELSSFESLIWEMEEKHQQPVTELLQDVRSTMQGCEQKKHFANLVAFPPDLKWKLQACCYIGLLLGDVRKQFQDTLVSIPPEMKKANVTLDPTTASTDITLSEDQRSIKFKRDAQDVPVKNYTRGDVLGCNEFTGGRHFWDVSVGSEDGWAVGVTTKPVKDLGSLTPDVGKWVVMKINGKYRASIDNIYPRNGELKRIRVCLYFEGEGRVAFLDADAGTLLYAFSGVPVSGQTLSPFFAVWDKGHLRLSS